MSKFYLFFQVVCLTFAFISVATTLVASDDIEVIIPPAVIPPVASIDSMIAIIDNWDGSRSWLKKGRIVYIDTETTGLSYQDRIVQLCMYECVDGKMTGNIFNSYFNPDMPSSAHAYKAHKLGYEFLLKQPRFIEKFQDIQDFIRHDMVVGFNVSFDVTKLMSEAERIPGAVLVILSKDLMAMERRDAKRAKMVPRNLISSPAPKINSAVYLTTQERKRANTNLYEARLAASIRNDAQVSAHLQANNTHEARNKRVVVRGQKRDRDEGLPDENGVDENSEPLGFSLGACAKRKKVNPEDVFTGHNLNLMECFNKAGIPKHRIGKPHDAFFDVALTVGVAEAMNSPLAGDL